jgi:hypothetical protein
MMLKYNITYKENGFPPFQFLNQLPNFHKTWYERYASEVHPTILFNFQLNNNMMHEQTFEE